VMIVVLRGPILFLAALHAAPFAAGNAVLFAAVASHYIQDACQPLYASYNYDGQPTNQHGVHVRFETALFERFESRLTVAAARPMTHPDDAAFDALQAGYGLVPHVLQADTLVEVQGSPDSERHSSSCETAPPASEYIRLTSLTCLTSASGMRLRHR
jgi:hypothetical protein